MNEGLGLFSLGVFIAVGLTNNYTLLLFLVPNLFLWQIRMDEVSNKRIEEKHNLDMKILKLKIKELNDGFRGK